MYINIYFSGKIGLPLSEIEDDLDDLLMGQGEVSGTGTGDAGSNIDIDVFDNENFTKVTSDIIVFIEKLSLKCPIRFDINGENKEINQS